jgi:Glycosyl hydrolase family 9
MKSTLAGSGAQVRDSLMQGGAVVTLFRSQEHDITVCVCRISPQGQRFVSEWGSNRYAMSGAAILLMWAKLPAEMRNSTFVTPQNAQCAAVKQIHYMAGDNDRGSYIVGFGTRPPVRNHHRNAACAPWEQAEDTVKHCQKCVVLPYV